MGLKLGVFGFLLTTWAKTNAIQMRPRSLQVPGSPVYIYGMFWAFTFKISAKTILIKKVPHFKVGSSHYVITANSIDL